MLTISLLSVGVQSENIFKKRQVITVQSDVEWIDLVANWNQLGRPVYLKKACKRQILSKSARLRICEIEQRVSPRSRCLPMIAKIAQTEMAIRIGVFLAFGESR